MLDNWAMELSYPSLSIYNMVCDVLSIPMGCCDGYIGSTTYIGDQRWDA